MRQWESYIRKVTPYVPGEQPGGTRLIKLNTNENPYPPSPMVEQAFRQMDMDQLRRYPDPTARILKDALAEFYHVDREQIFVGVGSDDVLGMAFLTFFNSDKPVLFPDVTYSFYKVWAELFQIPFRTPALDQEMRIRPEDYMGENGGIVFPNPNAPTGLFMPLDQVEEILAANPDSVVIADEAYIDFGGESAAALLDRYENLLVVQTFSKSRSMAGIRIGFALGSPRLIKALEDVKYSYNSYTMNLPAQVMGAAAVRDRAYFDQTVSKIVETREKAKKRLSALGFSFPDSKANFILATHETAKAEELFQALRQASIYVRYFPQPRLDNSLRITVGTPEEMESLYRFLENWL